MSNEIWAVVERRGDALAPVSREVLTAAGRVALVIAAGYLRRRLAHRAVE